MNRNNMKWAAMPIAALCLTLAGCSSDEAVETPTDTPRPFTINASLGADNATPGTRAGIKPGNTDESKEIFIWHTGDTFAAWLTKADESGFETTKPVFTIDSNYDSDKDPFGSASFKCPNFPADRDYEIVAVYPTDKYTAMDPYLQCEISTSLVQAEKNSTRHLATDMAMYATATVGVGAQSANLAFEHLTSLFRFTVKNENDSACIITQITVSSDKNVFGKKWFLGLDGRQIPRTATNSITLQFGKVEEGYDPTGLDLAAGKSFDGYALSGPSRSGDDYLLTDKTLTFTLTVKDKDGNEREYTSLALDADKIIAANNGATTWEAGKRYWFKLTLDDQLTVTLNPVTAMPGWNDEDHL